MEKEAVNKSFRDFVQDNPSLTAKQMQFLQLLQNHIAKNGGVSVEQLSEKPFTTLDTQGVDGVFLVPVQILPFVGFQFLLQLEVGQ